MVYSEHEMVSLIVAPFCFGNQRNKTLDSSSTDRKANSKGCKQAQFENFNKFTNACSASDTSFAKASESLKKAKLGT